MEKSPLNRLPAELRNKIYEHLFTDAKIYLDDFKAGAALVQTCKAIRSEARFLLFANADLVLDRDKVMKWLKVDTKKSWESQGKIAPKLREVFGAEALGLIPSRRLRLVRQDYQSEKYPALVNLGCCYCNGTSPQEMGLEPGKAFYDKAGNVRHYSHRIFCRRSRWDAPV